VHVTLTSVDYAPEDGCLKVFIKMYLDDFLLDTEQDEDSFLKDESKREITENYINQKFVILANDKKLTGKISNLELPDDEIKVYIEYKTSEMPKELLVKNLIMTELYNDQSNLVIIKIDKFEEGFKFTSEITEQIFKIEN
jgi:hypothetical protein